MALLFAEDGVHVNLSDPSEEAMDAVIEKAEQSGYHGKLKKHMGRPLDPHLLFDMHSRTCKITIRFANRSPNPVF